MNLVVTKEDDCFNQDGSEYTSLQTSLIVGRVKLNLRTGAIKGNGEAPREPVMATRESQNEVVFGNDLHLKNSYN